MTVNIELTSWNGATLQRAKHDKMRPYAMITTDIMHTNQLSIDAKAVLVFMLTLPDDWRVNVKHLASKLLIGRDKVRNILNELIEKRYAKRVNLLQNGKFAGNTILFFEEQQTQEAIENEIKIKFPAPEITGPVTTAPSNPPIPINKNTNYEKNITSLKVPEEPAAVAAVEKNISSECTVLAQAMIEEMKRAHPEASVPKNVHPLTVQIDLMIRLDSRSPEKILDVFRWAVNDSFWGSKMFKSNPAKYLRDKFNQLYVQMSSKTPIAGPKVDRRTLDKDGNPVVIKPRY